jgi:hypothetical protein
VLREVSSVILFSVKIIRRSQFRGPKSSRGSDWMAESQSASDFPFSRRAPSRNSTALAADDFVIFTLTNMDSTAS